MSSVERGRVLQRQDRLPSMRFSVGKHFHRQVEMPEISAICSGGMMPPILRVCAVQEFRDRSDR